MCRHAWFLSVWVGLAFLAGADRAEAVLITYVTTGVGSGQIGNTSFTDAAFTITILADTANVQNLGMGRFAVNNQSVQVQVGSTTYDVIAGSSYSFQSIGDFAYSQARVGDFWEDANFFLRDSALSSLDLKSPLGPVNIVDPPFGMIFQTTGGPPTNIFITRPMSQVTFQAALVPEPSTLLLAATGCVAGLAVGLRGRSRLR